MAADYDVVVIGAGGAGLADIGRGLREHWSHRTEHLELKPVERRVAFLERNAGDFARGCEDGFVETGSDGELRAGVAVGWIVRWMGVELGGARDEVALILAVDGD